MRKFLHSIFIVLVLGWSMSFAPAADAAVPLPWSTTYNCPDWKQSDGLSEQAVNCNGLAGWGGWTTPNGSEEQITAAANFPSGGGGKGQRHWIGDGRNNLSGGSSVVFTSPQKELWIRWYMRYEFGFQWDPLTHHKWIYVSPHYYVTTSEPPVVFDWEGWDTASIWTVGGDCAGSNRCASTPGSGWNTVMASGPLDANGNRQSDGQWHAYEVHLKLNTPGIADGVAETWIDGIRRISATGIDFIRTGGWTYLAMAENAGYAANGRDAYVDYDDVVISTTGYIGPLPTDTLAPAAPSNLTVQ